MDRHLTLLPNDDLHPIVEDGKQPSPCVCLVGRERHVHGDCTRIAMKVEQRAGAAAVSAQKELDTVTRLGVRPTTGGWEIARLSALTALTAFTLRGQPPRQPPQLCDSFLPDIAFQPFAGDVELVFGHPVHRVGEKTAPRINRCTQR